MRWKFRFDLLCSLALLLACGLTPALAEEKKPAEHGFVHRNVPGADGEKIDYVVFIPHDYDGSKDVPVILFLHGAGETKGGSKPPVDVGIGAYIKKNEKTFPFLTLIPQAQEKGWRKPVNEAMLKDILAATQKEFKIDSKRMYLTGLSMGGFGTWDYALAEPDKWAAIVPICGRGKTDTAEKIKDIPCWVFHGGMDKTVPVEGSRDMVAALKKAGGNPKYTEFPNDGHNSWDSAYGTAELWTWLAEQKKK